MTEETRLRLNDLYNELYAILLPVVKGDNLGQIVLIKAISLLNTIAEEGTNANS
jgi:hypothetical protein